MTTVDPKDFPAVPIGSVGHPSALAWGWIEQQQGVYTWSMYDQYVSDAQSHGQYDASTNTVDFVITFGDTPPWAASDLTNCNTNGGLETCPSPPANMSDFQAFVQALLNHYNGTTMPHVKYYELWNEANSLSHWTGTVQQLITMASLAAPIVHADPNSSLLTPSVTADAQGTDPNNMVNYMTAFLSGGGAQYVDGGTFHGYLASTGVTPYPFPEQDTTTGCNATPVDCYGSIVTKATVMRQVLDSNGLQGKPLLNTEGSWGDNNITDPDGQVAWLSRWMLLQAGRVDRVYWFTWGGGSAQPWGDIENSSLQPTTAGIAYAYVAKWLSGATVTPCTGDSSGTWTCALTTSGGTSESVVWNANGSTSYSVPSGFTTYSDLAGNVTNISGGTVTIGSEPICLGSGGC
jgi:hypothetical protein